MWKISSFSKMLFQTNQINPAGARGKKNDPELNDDISRNVTKQKVKTKVKCRRIKCESNRGTNESYILYDVSQTVYSWTLVSWVNAESFEVSDKDFVKAEEYKPSKPWLHTKFSDEK